MFFYQEFILWAVHTVYLHYDIMVKSRWEKYTITVKLFPYIFCLITLEKVTSSFRSRINQGLTMPMYLLISTIQALTYGPFINMFVALGEEVGWRGV